MSRKAAAPRALFIIEWTKALGCIGTVVMAVGVLALDRWVYAHRRRQPSRLRSGPRSRPYHRYQRAAPVERAAVIEKEHDDGV